MQNIVLIAKKTEIKKKKNQITFFFQVRELIGSLKTETINFVQSLKLVSVFVKLLKPLKPEQNPVYVQQKRSQKAS